MTVRLATCVAILCTAAVAAPAAAAQYRYERDGVWLDLDRRPSLLEGWNDSMRVRVGRDGRGLQQFSRGRWVHSIDDNAIEGLWSHARWVRTGHRRHLRRAERLAGWLARGQRERTGLYPLYWSYNVGEGLGRPLWLRPGWYGANVQGEAVSLLTRLYRATGKRRYLRQARLALRSFRRPVGRGGVVSTFLDTGLPFYEGYATLPVRMHTLAHMLYAMIGLYDMSDLSPAADRLFRHGLATVDRALPYYDDGQGRAVGWLLHLTDPPRPAGAVSGYFQEALVSQVRALASINPSRPLQQYRDRWAGKLAEICVNPVEQCAFPHPSG